jgi:hypothetical protein
MVCAGAAAGKGMNTGNIKALIQALPQFREVLGRLSVHIFISRYVRQLHQISCIIIMLSCLLLNINLRCFVFPLILHQLQLQAHQLQRQQLHPELNSTADVMHTFDVFGACCCVLLGRPS